MAVRRRSILVMSEGQCPHPGRSCWRGIGFEDSADNGAGEVAKGPSLSITLEWGAGETGAFKRITPSTSRRLTARTISKNSGRCTLE